MADVLVRRRSGQKNLETIVGTDLWSKGASEEVREHFFAPPFIADMLKITWGLEPGARILNIGSGAGTLVGALRSAGFDAFGIENCPFAHKHTAETIRDFNLHGEFTKLPFSDQYFDVVIETGLCHLPSEQIPAAIEELRRVTPGVASSSAR